MTLTENQKIWLDALRSGKYNQGNTYLCIDDEYCCLGVAAEIFGEGHLIEEGYRTSFDGHTSLAPEYVVQVLNLKDDVGSRDDDQNALAWLNDKGLTFAQIADIFEKNIVAYTKESV